ncbi:MAG: UDP-N-acetylmuramoyl-tripeptide--D-alanyl-D-alanine ligase [Candidatus Omnitrophica bacterium]|nr:UDP-N-acetylmuramoyl-tripeptide--D-alanyl-D-alanine ligase [Candidatus Omnitrophota bacterium]
MTLSPAFSLEEIGAATGGELVRAGASKEISGVSIDSRTIQPGNLFIAIQGPRFDGHDFLEQAFARGAAGAVVGRWPIPLVPVPSVPGTKGVLGTGYRVWKVPDTLRALGDLSRFHRDRFDLPVVAITGSAGKTTTKEMAAHLLSEKQEILAAAGTQNNQVGVPLTLLRLEPKHRAAVLELGTNRWGEIRRLTELARPTVGVITNIGPAHLETFGDLRGVLKEKGGLWEGMDPKGTMVLNADDPFLREAGKRLSQRVIWFGTDPAAQVRPDQLKFELPLPGRHNRMNALAALAVAHALGIDLSSAAARLQSVPSMAGRLAPLTWNGCQILDDSYNANPTSLKAALEVFRDLDCSGRRILVMGDMLELGEQAEALHAQAGRWVAASGVDLLVTVGRLAKGLLSAAWEAGLSPRAGFPFDTAQEAGEFLAGQIRPGDAVLLKGSRGMRMEQVLDVLKCSTISSVR